VRFIGRLSYSLYIWQQMFLGGKEHLPLPLALPCVLGAAIVSYRFIERPAIAFGQRLIASPRPPPALSSSV
jgi:peptidoglycan/LPS O-acetylase OafA/YrhL